MYPQLPRIDCPKRGRSNLCKRPLRRRKFRTARRASVTTEAVVSIIILAAATAVVSRFAATFQAGLKERKLAAQIGVEIVNTRELIGTWSLERVTSKNIAELPVGASLSDRLENARWEATIVDIDKPLSLRQVTLQLRCDYKGQRAAPESLTFWVSKAANSQDASGSDVEAKK